MKHNIFSNEAYGIGRFEFLGSLILISILVYAFAFAYGFIMGTIGIDRFITKIIGNIVICIFSIHLYSLAYAHRLYHMSWVEEYTNARLIAGITVIIALVTSLIPIINILSIGCSVIYTLILLLVPGSQEE